MQFRLVEPLATVDGCTVSALLGEDEIASDVILDRGRLDGS